MKKMINYCKFEKESESVYSFLTFWGQMLFYFIGLECFLVNPSNKNENSL